MLTLLLFAHVNSCFFADFSACESCAKWCYIHNFPDLAIHFCEESLKFDSGKSLEAVHLLKGKCYYQQYVQNKKELKLSSLSEDMKKQQYEEVFAPNIMAINALGEAFDRGYIDEEGSYLLDRAMMDCIFKVNMLDSCNRCYLCRQKLQGKKLIKSHIIPHSILNLIASDNRQGNKQVFFAANTPIKKASTRLLAPGEMVYFMLCHDCEQVISICGETQFSPHFFQKIYNKQDESDNEQIISYGPWLYQFCIGLIFRAINWDVNEYLNDSAIYAVFEQCRKCISDWSSSHKQDDMPTVYIFVSPLLAGNHELIAHKYLNWFLQGGLCKRFGSYVNDTSFLLKPSYFFIQVAMVTILVTFDQALSIQNFDQSFVINPTGGIYLIPPQFQRREKFPPALWKLFIESSKSLDKLVLSGIVSVPRKLQENYKQETISAGNSMAAAGIQSIISHSIGDMQKNTHHSLLPSSFTVSSIPKKIKLPKGHKILLHSNYVRESSSGSTFFICVGNTKKYPITKPYIIWHFYEPKSTVTSGAFFSVQDLQITDFLLGEKTIEYRALSGGVFVTAKNRIPNIIKDLLKEKGFSSIVSLLHRVQSATEAAR